ncbi:EF-hand calcium-binding domain-containing protein 2 isoform X1 [Drosophila serrata]|uniref:EF-hand calcium-binding domain-containing protein 2 isoform X1 n=2 Tax=Drosophila serrata TaxID=7274 RepID=UPI000A1D0982|nr:EF-hand calcium-binding domain-containing protein 2 isoform X1 [Drosophila serrata]
MEVGVTLSNELEVQIAEAFCIFDTHGDKYIDTRNVGNVLRFLGCAPTEKEVLEVIKATESTDYPGEAHISKFMAHVSVLLMDHKMEPASAVKIMEAFEVLDPENKKYLTKEYFGKLMAEEGEPFTEEELEEMWPVAIDPITGNIPFIFYLNQLKHKTKIYEVADAVKEELAQAEKEKGKKPPPTAP